MAKKLHASSPSGLPLCGRQLSIARLGAGAYNIGQQSMGLAPAGQPITCRHCLRVMGVLPPITRRGRDAEGEPEDAGAGARAGLDECLDEMADEAEAELEQ